MAAALFHLLQIGQAIYYSSQLVLMGAEFTRIYAGNTSAIRQPIDTAGHPVDHYVHVAVRRSHTSPPSWRCFSDGCSAALVTAINAPAERASPLFRLRSHLSADLARNFFVRIWFQSKEFGTKGSAAMSEVSSRTPRTRDAKQSRR